MYYANTFNYYTIKNEKKIYLSYTGCTLYKTKVLAENNAEKEWLNMAEDDEILTSFYTKPMRLWEE